MQLSLCASVLWSPHSNIYLICSGPSKVVAVLQRSALRPKKAAFIRALSNLITELALNQGEWLAHQPGTVVWNVYEIQTWVECLHMHAERR